MEFKKAYVKFEYDNGFGDITEMTIGFPESPTSDEMQLAFYRFMLGAGWCYENVKHLDPDYIDGEE